MPKSAPESLVSCPCCGLWHCEVTLLLCNAPCQVPTLHALCCPSFQNRGKGTWPRSSNKEKHTHNTVPDTP